MRPALCHLCRTAAHRQAPGVDPIELDLDQAIPLGLLLNELISNALKHAFGNGRGGWIRIDMRPVADQVVIRVLDNGIGMPADVNFLAPRSLGLELVHNLTDQIGGTIQLARETNGTQFTISFPISVSKEQSHEHREDPAGRR